MLWLMECTVFMHQLLHIQNIGTTASEYLIRINHWNLLIIKLWQAFVQESTRTIAASAGINLELNDGLAIDEVTQGSIQYSW